MVVLNGLCCATGESFLIHRKYKQHLASVNAIGSKNSTYLGMREIYDVSTLIHADVSLTFEEHSAVTTLQLPFVKVLPAAKLTIHTPTSMPRELVAPAPPEASIWTEVVFDYSKIVFICCDDDR